jgi:acetyltransferase
MIRALSRADEAAYGQFCRSLDREDLRLRLGRYVAVEEGCIRRMLQGRGDEEIALAEFAADGDIVGVGRIVFGAEPEIAVIVRPDQKRRGIGTALVEALVALSRSRQVPALRAYVLAENHPMLTLARRLGFRGVEAYGPMVTLELAVTAAAAAA